MTLKLSNFPVVGFLNCRSTLRHVGPSVTIFCEGFPLQSLTGYVDVLIKLFYPFPRGILKVLAQYSRLISFTPAANKPGELHLVNILVIEIGSYLSKHNSRLIKQFLNDAKSQYLFHQMSKRYPLQIDLLFYHLLYSSLPLSYF